MTISNQPMADLLNAATDLMTQSYERGRQNGYQQAIAVLQGIGSRTDGHEADVIKNVVAMLQQEAPHAD